MEMELHGAINKHQKSFVEELLELFSYWICYLKAYDQDNCPPLSNAEVAEVLLQMFFKGAASEIFEYLHTDKYTFIKNVIAPRANSIKYIYDEDLTEENISAAESFKKKAAEAIFKHIVQVSHNLLKEYCDRPNVGRGNSAYRGYD